MRPPEIEGSTKQERKLYIEETFRCRNHCESCGICQVYNGREPVIVYEDYIDGKREFWEIAKEYR